MKNHRDHRQPKQRATQGGARPTPPNYRQRERDELERHERERGERGRNGHQRSESKDGRSERKVSEHRVNEHQGSTSRQNARGDVARGYNAREPNARGSNAPRTPVASNIRAPASDSAVASYDTSSSALMVEPVAQPNAHLYGVMPVLEALRTGQRPIEEIAVAEGVQHFRLRELLEHARQANVPVRRAPRIELDRATGGANHQGVVATIAAARYADAGELLDALALRVGTDEPPLAVVLDGVEDPRNLGAILRTVDCAGAHGVFIPERHAVGLTDTVAKAAAGALEHVAVARTANLSRLIEQMKERRIWTIGTSADAKMSYTAWDWTEPCALFLGGEGAGLHRLVRERCDALVSIPIRGQITSLNVSVAAGIVLYEAIRQRTAANFAAYKSSIQDLPQRHRDTESGREEQE
jgi:23S rRNA (guanosine2251-2'-O)-methyltransferase